MKKVMIVFPLAIGMMLMSTLVFAQNKANEERMQRDIEVAENILSTLIKQQLDKRGFFPMEVEGSYLPGYGVTFHLPSSFYGSMFYIEGDGNMSFTFPPEPEIPVEPGQPVKSYSYSYSTDDGKTKTETRTGRPKVRSQKISGKRTSNADSAVLLYNSRLLDAAKAFIVDYSDLLTQLPPNEKIVVTNRNDGRSFHTVWLDGSRKQNLITVEGTKADVSQYRQGKITRDQLIAKLHIIDSEVSDELQPDLELLSSIFNRLYSRDLSKTFFCDDNIYYEKLKDYGAVYHMQVYASSQTNGFNEVIYDMPTMHLTDVDQATRDKKVKEMYPEFEKNIKEDILEYGRTIKSLKDAEVLMFDVTMTRCKGCSIPSSLELSVKYSVLKDYSSGKITKDAAMAKINLKKGPDQ